MSQKLCYNRLMKNNRTLLIVLIVVVTLFIGAVVFIPQLTKKSEEEPTPELNLSSYNLTGLIAADDNNGHIADHVKGDVTKAKLLIFEYADYQCSACALFSTWIDELVEEYQGEVAFVFRVYPLTSIHSNAIAAASAVEAAGLQGYWEQYASLVFANQAEWYYATGDKRTSYFVNYFSSVTKGAGDVAKFKEDMASANVKAKVNFDRAIAESYKLSATPSFIGEDGKEINFASDDVEQTKTGIMALFHKYIDTKLGK